MTGPPAKKAKAPPSPAKKAKALPSKAPLSELSKYEVQRSENIDRNNAELDALGLRGKSGRSKNPIPQTAEEASELPNLGIEELVKNMPPAEFDKFELAPLPDQEARNFELGQYVAKAWQSDDGSWKCYAARINLITKTGPWIIFESDRCDAYLARHPLRPLKTARPPARLLTSYSPHRHRQVSGQVD